MRTKIENILQNSILLHERIAQDKHLVEMLHQVVRQSVDTLRSGGKILLCGNGGSASDAQHIAAELSGRFNRDRPALDAVALTANTSALTAIANDYGYEDVFARQVEAHGRPGDLLLGISTSGNSPNVLKAILKAKELGLNTVALTGEEGGKLKDVSHFWMAVPSKDTPRIQEGHILIGHILCAMIEDSFFG